MKNPKGNEDFVENENLPDLPPIEGSEVFKKTHPELYRMAQEIYAHAMGIITLPDPPHFQVHD